MLNLVRASIAAFLSIPALTYSAEPVRLGEDTYKSTLGVVIIQMNWGRVWKCGQYENAQLQALGFTRIPVDAVESVSLDLKTPSKLFVENKFLPYAYVVQPGEYVLTSFDVKVARSRAHVAHIAGAKDSLVKDGKAIGGTFTVDPGEIVYVGHFGLDCGAEPFLWRYHLDGREEFEKYVEGFRQEYPFVKQVPVRFRLFSTQLLGRPYQLQDPVVR